jgi:hypothetical protein
MVEVIGATMTVGSTAIAERRLSTTTGRRLSGGAKR